MNRLEWNVPKLFKPGISCGEQILCYWTGRLRNELGFIGNYLTYSSLFWLEDFPGDTQFKGHLGQTVHFMF